MDEDNIEKYSISKWFSTFEKLMDDCKNWLISKGVNEKWIKLSKMPFCYPTSCTYSLLY